MIILESAIDKLGLRIISAKVDMYLYLASIS